MDPSSTKNAGISGTPSTATQPHTETAPDTVPYNETTVNMFSSRLTAVQSVVLIAVLLSIAYFFFMLSPWIVSNKADYGRETEYSVAFGPLFEPPQSTKEPARLHLGILTMQLAVFAAFGWSLVYIAGCRWVPALLKYASLLTILGASVVAIIVAIGYVADQHNRPSIGEEVPESYFNSSTLDAKNEVPHVIENPNPSLIEPRKFDSLEQAMDLPPNESKQHQSIEYRLAQAAAQAAIMVIIASIGVLILRFSGWFYRTLRPESDHGT